MTYIYFLFLFLLKEILRFFNYNDIKHFQKFFEKVEKKIFAFLHKNS